MPKNSAMKSEKLLNIRFVTFLVPAIMCINDNELNKRISYGLELSIRNAPLRHGTIN